MSNEYKPTYVDNTDNSISIMESTDTISFCKTGTKINTLSAKNVAHKKTGENLNLCAYDGSNFNPVITINNNHSDCRIMTNLNVNGNVNITNNLIIPTHSKTSNLLANIQGSIYYNTSENMYEGYSQTEGWQPLGGFSKTKDAVIHKNLNVIGNINLTNEGMIKTTGIGSFGSINISKLAINGDYGSSTKYLKSGGEGSDLTWDTIASSPWASSGNNINYNSGNVGIGVSPTEALEVNGKIKTNNQIISTVTGTPPFVVNSSIMVNNLRAASANEVNWNGILNRPSSFNPSSHSHSSFNNYVMINSTNSASYPLEVRGYANQGNVSGWYRSSSGSSSSNGSHGQFSAKFEDSILAGDYIFLISDTRIKTNIVDVPDNLALQQLRSIPCRYYEYIDKLKKGSDKTIGFIAQEVREVMPMAVSLQKEITPDVYKVINCDWVSVDDKFNMSSTELTNVSDVKYKFYVSNESDGSDEKEIILTGNSDNTFTFDTQYTNVFCYGSEVDDFHVLDKNKLLALNFSASQEFDRIQQTHITEIASLKTENQQQQNEINTLKTENAELKSIIDKLKTANSFEEFKNSL